MKRSTALKIVMWLALAGSATAVAAPGPRIALFWNQEFTSEVRTEYEDFDRQTRRMTSGSSEEESETWTEQGRSRHRQVDETLNDVTENTRGSRMLPNGSRRPLREDAAWRIEGAFLGEMQSASGARFVDRAAMIRANGRGVGSADKVNLQALEAAALAANADLLMQVLMEQDANSPIGMRFNVRVTRVRDSQIVSVLSTLALPPRNSRVVWTTDSTGFKKEVISDPVDLEDYGQELARQVAAKMAF